MYDCSGDQEPLQMILNLEQTVALLEKVTLDLSSCHYSSIQPSIISLSFNLKRHGPSLELHHGELLKRLQQVLRSSCRDTKLDLVSRVHLLQIIEMRSAKWAPSHHITEFYKIKLEQIKQASGSSPGTALAGSSALASSSAPSSARTNSSPIQTIVSKPFSRLNADAPDFCLGTSHLLKNISNTSIPIPDTFVPNQPSIPAAFPPKPNVLHPDSPAFISRHQPSFHHSPLVNSSGDYLKSNPVNNQSMEEYDGSGDFRRKEDNNNSKNDNIVQCDKMGQETFKVQSENSSQYKTTVHTEKGDIFMTSFSVDLLHTAKQLLEEGLKDKTVKEDSPSFSSYNEMVSPKLIYQNSELLELAKHKLPPSAWEKNVN